MPILELSEEQTRTWSRAQKDRWWLDNVFRGDLPQLTWRSAATGFALGGVLSATNLYIGAKSGVTIGVGLTSVILAFALFKMLSRMGVGREFSILENNAMQSIATAAGYMTSPLISSLAALMLMTGKVIPWWQLILWNVVVCSLGVLVAFPLKRRFINDDQLPFPEGRACGVVLDTLYSGGSAGEGMLKARVLVLAGAIAGTWQLLISEGWMRWIQFKLFALDKTHGWASPLVLHEKLDEYYYALAAKYDWWVPRILGTEARTLDLRLGCDLAMVGVGGLMGLRTSAGVLMGSLLNFALLAPLAYHGKWAPFETVRRGEFINKWGLWWPITAMVVGAMVGLFAKPRLFTETFALVRTFLKKRDKKQPGDSAREHDVLAHIELPLWVSFAGIPVLGFCGAWMANAFFGASWWLVLASVPLIFLLSIIAANAMALTSWTPTGALSKITQFTMGAIDNTNAATNLSTAGMTGEVVGNAANLLSDIKPGYMLGAKPRQQAVGHFIGILSGAIASTPLFYLLFLPADPVTGARTVTSLTEKFPMPGAVQWRGVAEFIQKGMGNLPASVIVAMAVAGILALVFELLRLATRGRFPLSGMAIGLGAVLPPDGCLCMFAGALIFHLAGKRHNAPGTRGHLIWVGCLEPICAGLITGAALVGIGDAVCKVLLQGK